MPRVRLGVALLIPAPLNGEIDGLRRAAGDGALGRISAHCTLVPPVNVADGRLDDALRRVREAAAATRPFTLQLGPPATFLPDTPVLQLPVADDDGAEELRRLRDRVFVDPLCRPLTWPFVPHVTLADEIDPARVRAALAVLADYRVTATFERLHLLQEGPGRLWEPIADAAFARPAVIGRGGLELELSATEQLDPPGRALRESGCGAYRRDEGVGRRPFAISGRRDGQVAGVAEGWTSGAGAVAFLECLVVSPEWRGEGIGSHLLGAFESLAAERGSSRLVVRTLAGGRPESFFRRRGWLTEEARLTDWHDGHDVVFLRR